LLKEFVPLFLGEGESSSSVPKAFGLSSEKGDGGAARQAAAIRPLLQEVQHPVGMPVVALGIIERAVLPAQRLALGVVEGRVQILRQRPELLGHRARIFVLFLDQWSKAVAHEHRVSPQ
jgi:hypothetical protein